MKDFYCSRCGSKTDGNMKFCNNCYAGVEEAPTKQESSLSEMVQNAEGATHEGQDNGVKRTNIQAMTSSIVSATVFASQTAGSVVLKQGTGNAGDMFEILAPLKLIKHTISGLLGKTKGAIKDKKRLIPVIVVTLILGLLMPKLGVDTGVSRFLSFLTFAQGRTAGGFLGILGGTVGKGLFSYFVISLIMPLFSTKGKRFGDITGGLKNLFGSFSIKSVKEISPMLIGAGFSLITYNFMNTDLIMQNSMIAIAAAFLSVKALSNKAGFLQGFLRSIISRSSKGKTPDFSVISRLIAGATTGFALSIPITAIKIPYIASLLGLVLIITSVILFFVLKGRGKEAREI